MLRARRRAAASSGSAIVLALFAIPVGGGAAQAATPCPYYNFCAYMYANFEGPVVYAEDCNAISRFRWTSTNGSWINNQTRGTRARINYMDGTHWYVPGAYSEQSSGMGWHRVESIDPC
ncbi:hypothetical protein Ade02nite_18500 [Paractinoplanes deccanensis]|uniref:Peptidase inhibitor family I36 n=1 Tax=Paractinoplanes deccanensis TaxID=113561 RepID=A0ABQ3XZN6_9ACTN|nr:hypothetical protein Ade02nite_18500 [Actinoplanes deccanensis]